MVTHFQNVFTLHVKHCILLHFTALSSLEKSLEATCTNSPLAYTNQVQIDFAHAEFAGCTHH